MGELGLPQVPPGGNIKRDHRPRRWANVKHALADVASGLTGLWLSFASVGFLLRYSEEKPSLTFIIGMVTVIFSVAVFGAALLRARCPKTVTFAALAVSLVVTTGIMLKGRDWSELPSPRERATEVIDFARTLPAITSGQIASEAIDTIVILVKDDLKNSAEIYWTGWMLCGYAGALELWGWKVQIAAQVSEPIYECAAH